MPLAIELELEGGQVVLIQLGEIGRYDQFHLAINERFDFESDDIILTDDLYRLKRLSRNVLMLRFADLRI